jgi:CubicO group peptidase (beta-lactamase class C family)
MGDIMTVEVQGFCDERFQPLKDAFVANFDAGLELGASLAVTYRGKTVVDLWAGWADPETSRPWQEDTIVDIASTTKMAAALCALILVDRGLLALDEPVARYWPEFAEGGKAAVTVREALSHQAGVPGLVPAIPMEMTWDFEAFTTRLAAEPHWFEGQRRVAYHAFTYNTLIGGLIRRADGRPPRQFFIEEIAVPADLDRSGCRLARRRSGLPYPRS